MACNVYFWKLLICLYLISNIMVIVNVFTLWQPCVVARNMGGDLLTYCQKQVSQQVLPQNTRLEIVPRSPPKYQLSSSSQMLRCCRHQIYIHWFHTYVSWNTVTNCGRRLCILLACNSTANPPASWFVQCQHFALATGLNVHHLYLKTLLPKVTAATLVTIGVHLCGSF